MKKKEDFQIWLDQMGERIQELRELLPQEVGAKLDYSESSLFTIEQYILNTFSSIEHLKAAAGDSTILDKLARYFGEVVRRNIDSCLWFIILDNKRHSLYQIPVIAVLHPKWYTDSPYYVVMQAVSHRTGNYLTEKVNLYRKFIEDHKGKPPRFSNEFNMPD